MIKEKETFKILVPTDLSEHSRKALGIAIDICNRLEGELHIISAFHVPKNAASFISLDEKIKGDTEAELEKLKESIRYELNPGLNVNIAAYKAKAAHLIKDYSIGNKIDLVVMGTQGMSNLKNILVGSVTKNTVKESEIPVLAIPPNAETTVLGNRFLLALDNSVIERGETLNVLRKLYEAYQARLYVYHMSKKEELIPIDPYVSNFLPDMIEDVIVEEGRKATDSIKAYVDSHDIDLLAMIRRSHTFLEKLFVKGFTEEELFKSNVPLLVLPE